MIIPCPTCNTKHDVSNRITGDWILCGGCGAWLALVHHEGGSAFVAKSEPTKKRRRKTVKK